MKSKPGRLAKFRRNLAKHSLVLVCVAVLATVAIAFLARGDRTLRIDYESDNSRLEINSSPRDVH